MCNRYHDRRCGSDITSVSCVTLITLVTESAMLLVWPTIRIGRTWTRGNPMAASQVNDVSAVKLRLWRVLTMLASLVAVIVGLVAIFMSAA